MAQNIYDDPAFHAGYSRLDRSVHGLAGAPEWPTVRALIPNLAGRRVLDLGCGFGWFSRWAREAGAAAVLGLDLSDRMLARARSETPDAAVTYEKADLDRVELPQGAFDFAYSSLALHYVADVTRLFSQVYRALAPGSAFVFTTEHPIYMAADRPGWLPAQAGGRKTWPVNGYALEGERRTDWLAPGVVKHHRRIATTVNTLVESGFAIRRLCEWSPTPEDIAARPALADELERPMLLIIAADRIG
ncbi:class I SAM-dependent methyltransferase [Phreatobacter sp.]|uniref:class I SAM-dependent methyltransferase n=1 Tax=Phreatobacter sp. TaxID=1966341 RepID=UPI003F7063F1